ncbi:MAG: M56 family metallopeptidase [Pseudomonadota bacterium]
MKPVLDLAIDANLVLVVAFVLWWAMQSIVLRSGLRSDFRAQAMLLRWVLLLVVASPVLSHLAVEASRALWPRTPLTASDLAVAVYLKGGTGLPAVEFEALLDSRDRILDRIVAGETWLTWVALGLALGGAAHLVRTLLNAARLHRTISESYLWRQTRRTDIHLSDTVAVPFAARGLFRRHIVLPSGLLAERDALRLVLSHEIAHLRQGDVEWEVGLELVRPLLYWNPVFLVWKRHFDRLRELGCDQSVLATGRVAARDYASALLSISERSVTRAWPRAMHVTFVRTGPGSARLLLEARIRALGLTRRGRGGRTMAFAFALLIGFGIVLAAMSIRQPGDWSHDRLMLSTVVNLERLEAINRGF